MPQIIYPVYLGSTALTPSFHAVDNAAAVRVMQAMQGASELVWDRYYSAEVHAFSPADPSIGSPDLRRCAALNFTSSHGRVVRILVPSFPVDGLLSDNETVNPSDSRVAALIAQFLIDGRTGSGDTLVGYKSGNIVLVPYPPIARY